MGYSFCGLVAVELAAQLEKLDRTADVLLLEPPLPGVLPTRAKVRRRAVLAGSAASPYQRSVMPNGSAVQPRGEATGGVTAR